MTTTGHSTTRPMSAMAGPSHSSGESRRRAGIEFILRARGCVGPGSAGPHAESDSRRYLLLLAGRGGCGLLQLGQHRARVAGDGGADRLLNLGLHVRPRGVAWVLYRVRQRGEERREDRVGGQGLGTGNRRREQVVLVVEGELVLVLVGEVEELLDLRLVTVRLERGDVVAHPEGDAERAV